jgi:hypothetical protein
MTREHTFRPGDEFRARLEQEVLRRHRMGSSIQPATGRSTRTRVRMGVIIVVSMVLGATAGFASAQVGRNAERDSLLAAARAEAALANSQRDLAQAMVNDVEQKLRAGLVGMETSIQANADLAVAEHRRKVLAIDIEEITATGASPRDDLNAPLVDGRDFVKQRIEADASVAQARLRAAENLLRIADARMRAGAGATDSPAALDAMTIRAELAVLAEKLALRNEFLKNGTSIGELAQRLDAARAKQDAGMLQERLAAARARLATFERQRSTAGVSEVELLRAKLAVLELEMSLARMQQAAQARP